MTKEEREDAINFFKEVAKREVGTYCKIAIEALKQQPCDNCISREEAIKWIENIRKLNKYYHPEEDDDKTLVSEVINILNQLPPAISKEKTVWIPISERLPEDGQNVLFCDIDNDIMIGYHVKGRPYTHFSQNGTYEDIKNVIAWMPLPESFESQESEGITKHEK